MFAWGALALATLGPVAIAATSPYLAYRDAIYIGAGFAGIAALALLLVQPLLAGNHLPGIGPIASRRLHAIVGLALVAAVLAHVAGLWVTSPPDVIDALTFTSPTPFSVWGVIAMWAVFTAALLAAARRRLRWRPKRWRAAHLTLAAITVAGTVAHAMLIEGAMGTWSKAALCALAVAATLALLAPRIRPRGAARGLDARPARR